MNFIYIFENIDIIMHFKEQSAKDNLSKHIAGTFLVQFCAMRVVKTGWKYCVDADAADEFAAVWCQNLWIAEMLSIVRHLKHWKQILM